LSIHWLNIGKHWRDIGPIILMNCATRSEHTYTPMCTRTYARAHVYTHTHTDTHTHTHTHK